MFDFRRAAAGELDELFRKHASPDFQLRIPVEYPDVDDVAGLDAVRALFGMFEEIWDEWRHHPEQWARNGDTVVVISTLVTRGKGSGAEVSTPHAHVWRLDGERAARLDVKTDRRAALAAAGIAPEELRNWS